MIAAISFALASALVTSAADFNVTVGANNQLVFDPTSVTVQNGDTVHFEFVSKNHSATQSTFANPCARLDGGVDSGFLNVADNVPSVWSFTVNDASSPFWFHCAQTSPANHCQTGMVFAINPTADKSFDAFQAAAKSNASGTTPGDISAESSPGTTPPANATDGANAGTPSSSGSDTSVPSGTGFSTSNATTTPSSGASSPDPTQNPNGAIFTRGSSSIGVATITSLIVAFVF
ncbi:hypothetical protein Agabi119p4_2668 [Agaricus bisporus var. burnettii]|uniref:Phytocyanin domain-containing protein n=1 Tax=Agaricus bisporus var. burnettii TaxID=192524 RepID=A0A8H7F9P3_AGABI|nr:hypothetical protein Agabi119p4_2668 [Agaricus bisporus var. burnettii]